MTHEDLAKELNLSAPFIGVKRITSDSGDSPVKSGCVMRMLKDVFAGRRVVLTDREMTNTCPGGRIGFGFSDGLAPIPGGHGYFLAGGRGEGFPPGERLKCTPALGEASILGQARAVLSPFNALEFKPLEAGDPTYLVLALVNNDQLSALNTLYNYRSSAFDSVIMPQSSGCASIARIPLGEMKSAAPRAVIGNSDIVSRMFFDKDTVFFTVTGARFDEMLADADDSFLFTKEFRGVKKRLNSAAAPKKDVC